MLEVSDCIFKFEGLCLLDSKALFELGDFLLDFLMILLLSYLVILRVFGIDPTLRFDFKLLSHFFDVH